MGKKSILNKKGKLFFIYIAAGALLLGSCATTSTTQSTGQPIAVIKSISVNPGPDRTVVEITYRGSAPYKAFKLLDPPRIILDIRAKPSGDLPKKKDVYSGELTTITAAEGRTQALTTRVTIGLLTPLDYAVEDRDGKIMVTLTPQKAAAKAAPKATAGEQKEIELPFTPSEPRIFFKKKPIDLTQILGIDFTMLAHGKSRVIVTTDKKARYSIDQKGAKTIVLAIPDATIPPLIMRQVDSSQFNGAVDRIKASRSPAGRLVTVEITLKEMVPYHVKQTRNEITIDFGRTSVRPVEKKIVPLRLAQGTQPAQAQAPAQKQTAVVAMPVSAKAKGIPGLQKKYTGAPMTMDFVNADVTNILRLIAEVSNLNIVWGPDVKGTVSMRLKNVPWDQALDLVLDNNNLGMRRVGNVIWVTTKSHISQIEAEERRKVQEYEAQLEAARKKMLQEKEKEKELEPLVTQYIPVDFAKADEIKALIPISEAGKKRGATISVDARTNTIIIKDIASSVEQAKQIVKQFDTPVKQVMIEARIVDASDDFIRDLGIQWDQFQIQQRSGTGVTFTDFGGTPSSVDPATPGTDLPAGSRLVSPTFVTNIPSDWTPNMGLVFSKLSGSGLTATILDAKLALSESEGTSKIISAPKVIAMNGQSATISRGDSIIIPATENVASTTLDATLSLTVTPTVSFNNYITLDVQVTDDSAPTTTRLKKKSIETKLMVKSGETVVIGGIYKEDNSKDENGIPGLRRIPFFGWLFKAQRKKKSKSELLIFLTPTVVPSWVKS